MTKDVLTHGAHETVSSLAEICLQSSLRYLESSKVWNENTFLPEDICEALICKKLKTGHCDDDFVAKYFADTQTSRITKIHISGATITESGVEVLSVHPLREVDLSNCEVSGKAIVSLIKCKNTLTSLNLSRCRRITAFNELRHLTRLKSLDLSDTFLEQRYFDCLSALIHLRSLNVNETEITSLEPVKTMTLLTNLDLSKCGKIESIEPLAAIKGTLQWLSLYNCRELFLSCKKLIETLEELTQLQHLDLSKDDPEEPIGMHSFLQCAQILADKSFLERLLPSLPNLTWLDLSGNTKFSFNDLQLFKKCYPQRLKFLGLLMTDMCTFPEIPADEVSGNGNPKQVTFSVTIYNDRPTFLLSAMRELFDIIRREEVFGLDKNMICNVVLGAMESHTKDKHIQLAGSASLYHLSRDDDDNPQQVLAAKLKRRVIEVTLSAMDYHVGEPQLQRNCCLTLCNFRIPSEMTCDYRRMVEVLLRTAMVHKNDVIQRIAIGLCNMLVCQVQDSQKLVVGRDLEGVEKILQIMRYKMGNSPERGEVLECCWSALWNVTDETPENCELFIAHGGIELFMDCKTKLGDQRDLVRNMLGLMGNVAEVTELRSELMAIVHVFYDLLETEDQLEVTYNAGGIISHLAFDGPDNWTNHLVSRDQALERLVETVGKWDINTHRQMSYRSFAPILKLISGCDTPAIHYWATWALANLCSVDPVKYCKLVAEEGGVELLQALRSSTRTSSRIRELVDMTLSQCRQLVEHA